MGHSRYDAGAYKSYMSSTRADGVIRAAMGAADYKTTTLKTDFDPKVIKVRESRKSDLNPNPTPLIVGLDVSGSMGKVVEAMRRGLGTLFEEVINRDPIPDPHVLAMAIGDMDFDSAPVQATQFEADPVTIGHQIEDLYLERGGGGNAHESYLGPLYFALMRTDCDAFKDNRKGYLFTVGDEEPHLVLESRHIKQFFGDGDTNDMSAEDLIAAVSRNWHYFHVIVGEGDHASRRGRKFMMDAWNQLLGQRVLWLADHHKLAEVVISTIEVTNGRDKDAVVKSWSGGTDLVVKEALAGLTAVPGAGSGATTGPAPL